MTSATSNTKWPSTPIEIAVKAKIDQLFAILDEPRDEAGVDLASKIFTPDGVLAAATAAFTGSEEISRCRQNAWGAIKARSHSVRKVYAHDAEGRDLLIIGDVDMTLRNGQRLSGSFCALILFHGPDTQVKKYQVWADSAPMVKALAEAEKSKA